MPTRPGEIPQKKKVSGAYLLVFRQFSPKTVQIGSLGPISFSAGFYIYVGSAMGHNLFSRVSRHLKPASAKKIHWHIDYLAAQANEVGQIEKFFLLPSRQRFECELAELLSTHAERFIPSFGSSDCSCPSHLFYFGPSSPFSLLN